MLAHGELLGRIVILVWHRYRVTGGRREKCLQLKKVTDDGTSTCLLVYLTSYKTMSASSRTWYPELQCPLYIYTSLLGLPVPCNPRIRGKSTRLDSTPIRKSLMLTHTWYLYQASGQG